MGEQSPICFNRNDSDVILRDLLPESIEFDVRSEILKILHSSKEFHMDDFEVIDFEFMDVHGKKAVIPTCYN